MGRLDDPLNATLSRICQRGFLLDVNIGELAVVTMPDCSQGFTSPTGLSHADSIFNPVNSYEVAKGFLSKLFQIIRRQLSA